MAVEYALLLVAVSSMNMMSRLSVEVRFVLILMPRYLNMLRSTTLAPPSRLPYRSHIPHHVPQGHIDVFEVMRAIVRSRFVVLRSLATFGHFDQFLTTELATKTGMD